MNAIDLYDKPGVFPKPRRSGRIPYLQTFHDCGGRLQIYWKNAVCRIDFFRLTKKFHCSVRMSSHCHIYTKFLTIAVTSLRTFQKLNSVIEHFYISVQVSFRH